jgi:hypothetical protein
MENNYADVVQNIKSSAYSHRLITSTRTHPIHKQTGDWYAATIAEVIFHSEYLWPKPKSQSNSLNRFIMFSSGINKFCSDEHLLSHQYWVPTFLTSMSHGQAIGSTLNTIIITYAVVHLIRISRQTLIRFPYTSKWTTQILLTRISEP